MGGLFRWMWVGRVVVISVFAVLTGCAAENLHDAAKTGQPDRIVELLKTGQDVNGQDMSDYTPLHWAAYSGELRSAEVLVEHGAKLELRDKQQMTPLIVAVYYGHEDVADYLLFKGADPNARDQVGWTALSYAASEDNVPMTKLLLDYKASLTASTDKASPLTIAHDHKSAEIEKFLLAHGAK